MYSQNMPKARTPKATKAHRSSGTVPLQPVSSKVHSTRSGASKRATAPRLGKPR